MPLSYSSGYSSVRPAEIQQQQVNPFASALQAVQERKQAQQERQQKLVQSREQFAKDEYYGMHADVLKQAAQQLIDREDDFARDDVSMQKYTEAWQNLSEMADMFKTYKANTYGSPEDDPSAATFLAAEKRSMGIDPFAADGFEATVGYNEMMDKLSELNQGSMEVSLGDDLEILIGGKKLIETDFGTSNNPFDPKLNVANISGARAFEGVWNRNDMTSDAIDAKMRVHLENGDNMIKAVNHYIRSVREKTPSYNRNVGEVLNDPTEREQVIEQYIQEAQEYYETQAKEKKPDPAAEANARKKRDFLNTIDNGSEYVSVKTDPTLDEPDQTMMIDSIVSLGGNSFIFVGDDGEIYLYNTTSTLAKPIGKRSPDATSRSKATRELTKYGLTIESLYEEMTR